MADPLLLYTYKRLTKKDHQALVELSDCAFFNKKPEITRLCLFLKKEMQRGTQRDLTKDALYTAAFPKAKFDNTKLRLCLSATLKLVERYLAIQQMESEPYLQKHYVQRKLLNVGIQKRFERVQSDVQRTLDTAEKQDAAWHFACYQQSTLQLETLSTKERSSRIDLRPLHEHITAFYLSEMLRHACSLLTHQAISAKEYDMDLLRQVLVLAERFGPDKHPAISIYFHAFQALLEPEVQEHFEQWKTQLLRFESAFTAAELRSIYLLGINFCIRRMNSGEQDYIREAFDLYKAALSNDLLYENGYLSGFTFKNIIRIAAALKENDWLEHFFKVYQEKLEPKRRHNLVRYNQAFLYFKNDDYSRAMPLLQQVEFGDTLNNLDARRMLLRIYFELGEFDALDSHLHSFSTYLRRKKDLGYHRDMYLNLIRFTKALMDISPKDKKEQNRLLEDLQAASAVAEKEWLLGIIKKYK